MSHPHRIYAVPTWVRLLAGGAAAVAAVSLPLLIGSASKLQVITVIAAGAFSASIAVFGRWHETRRV